MDKDKYYEPTVAVQRAYSGGLGGGTSTAPYDHPPTEVGSVVRDGISANEETLSEVHEAISRLEARLDTALTPMPPQPTADGRGGNAVGGPPCSHVAIRLAALNGGARHAVERLCELTRRVEV